MKKSLLAAVVVIVLIGALILFTRRVDRGSTADSDTTSGTTSVEVIVTDLAIPWEIVFLPEGDMLVTERPGNLVRVSSERVRIPIAGVEHRGEGGLLGMALHPDFESNGFVYLYLTTEAGGGLTNRVERYRLDENTVSDKKTIVEGIPGSSFHDGGRIAFGPDGYLYITTGDAGNEPSAQDTKSLSGKILRVSDEGEIPADNPFGNAVYSYGHRNPQGLAWDGGGRLYATEHGRSGALSGYDEVNRIIKGGNYGWPEIQGDETREGMITPLAHSGGSNTWAPSGLIIHEGSLFFTGLRGEALYEAVLSGEGVARVTEHLAGEYGRLRTIVRGPDGLLYIATNNGDGRGDKRSGDDKIIRINPDLLKMRP